MENKSPLLCDYENGTCEIPVAVIEKERIVSCEQKQKPIQVTYFTDPICSSCWGIEPQLRKLKLEYGKYINIDYRMGGLLPSWNGFNGGGITRPSDVAYHWDEVSKYYEMPIDGNIWLEDPLDSSYPPSVAFIAAKMQDKKKAEIFLRIIREMLFLEKKNITKWEHLVQAALKVKLDIEKFSKDYNGEANELFQADLDFTRSKGVRGFPSLFFVNENGEQEIISGYKSYERFEQIILDLYPHAKKEMIDNSAENIFMHYPTLTTKEFAVITDRSKEEAEKILKRLVITNSVEKINTRNGDFWKLK